ncbi:MAG: FtsK/SpoIIIE domain-containing protein, partial [Planctomycetota bacterium]|nr:FtsK/SpoIIIE domain-containing protein [Planctomycetota bacterium]
LFGAVGVGAGLVVAGIGLLVARRAAIQSLRPQLVAIMEAEVRAQAALQMWLAENLRSRHHEEHENKRARDEAIDAARANHAPKAMEVAEKKAKNLAVLDGYTKSTRSTAQSDLDRTLRETSLAHAAQLADAQATLDEGVEIEDARHRTAVIEVDRHEEESIEAFVASWCACRDSVQEMVDAITTGSTPLLMDWEAAASGAWVPSVESVGGVPFGRLTLDASLIPGCEVPAGKLAWREGHPPKMAMPAMLTFPDRGNLLLETDAEGRNEAIACMQSLMMRLLTLVPPGKVRMTVIDPVGLGQGFAGFMHLADHLETLIGERIWTETRHIESRLSELTEHMETVIQKYLRDEFASIEEYNQQAGEIAEPLRYLVVCDFPNAFSEQAVRRLNSIIESGARCGVHAIVLRDTRVEVPTGTDLELMHSRMVRVHLEGGRWVVETDGLRHLQLALETPPSASASIRLVNQVGKAAKSSSRVAVPFDAIMPRPEQVWTGSTEKSVSVALGRSGATRLQELTLGVGTGQHALIAGRTGSGKSTLLHAIITNLALWYSPDEVELWLIDFKKGVEFKTYATHALPHARAVAVETDREFGLSVLNGLDVEMKRRGELFRQLGVQDLAGYRRAMRTEPMPRVLLIVDEFQELFVEDDKVGQDATLLLDRLIRQGRAFGMHVVLGSQTLGGAYALPRTTMGQMAIRIALQCNEADASLILSDDNPAARLLSRPGEAIYNDAAGLLEGNSPFQVCWLDDERRDVLLAAVAERAKNHPPKLPSRLVVFEGNAAAVLDAGELLRRTQSNGVRTVGGARPPVCVWLGDAVSIKEPTHIPLRRQSGSNVVVVGQRDDAALGLSTAALASLAAQSRVQGDTAIVEVIDGIAPDEAGAGALAACHLASGLLGAVSSPREVADVISRVAAEVTRRMTSESADGAPMILMLHGAHRFRSIRRNEDDYSFGSSDSPPTTDKLFQAILRDGPLVGVHVILWVDTVTNLNRIVDRAGMRELDWRVCFQLSNNDSSSLIDSPAASRLGQHRALLSSEELGSLEKFRPYAQVDPHTMAALRGVS